MPIQDPRGKIGKDEPVILFRVKDMFFNHIIWLYIMLLTVTDGQEKMIELLQQHGELAKKWQKKNGCKMPDVPQ